MPSRTTLSYDHGLVIKHNKMIPVDSNIFVNASYCTQSITFYLIDAAKSGGFFEHEQFDFADKVMAGEYVRFGTEKTNIKCFEIQYQAMFEDFNEGALKLSQSASIAMDSLLNTVLQDEVIGSKFQEQLAQQVIAGILE